MAILLRPKADAADLTGKLAYVCGGSKAKSASCFAKGESALDLRSPQSKPP